MNSLDSHIHPLHTSHSVQGAKLNNPFHYRPSPVILEAQRLVLNHIEELRAVDNELREETDRGKMFGVMVVRDSNEQLGYIAAFSGCIAGRTHMDYFVPPITGRGEDNHEFAIEDQRIGDISREIEQIKNSEEYKYSQSRFEQLQRSTNKQIEALNRDYATAKQRRDEIRKESDDPQIIANLQRESQHQKGEMRRAEHRLKGELKSAKTEALKWREIITQKQEQRRELSNSLQRKMFQSYKVINGEGEWQSLYTIFDDLLNRLPPSGSGECAAPKLLQYTLTQHLTPIAIGEFWYGPQPRGEVRHHGHFYGACRSRCYPILTFMLRGLEVAEVECEIIREAKEPLEVLYDDKYLVVFNKPAGMLSVPGRSSSPSVKSIMQEMYPEATGSLIVHRLDQDTSGVLVMAKDAEVHRALQRQFSERKLSKRYVAIVEGVIKDDKGEITLPLIPNIYDRPRQMVDYERGKPSLTTYEVIERGSNFTWLALYPHTGRTHQLRLHCAHVDGLNTPIKGDRLYGRELSDIKTRLHLHAEQITFAHPISGEEMTIRAAATF